MVYEPSGLVRGVGKIHDVNPIRNNVCVHIYMCMCIYAYTYIYMYMYAEQIKEDNSRSKLSKRLGRSKRIPGDPS